MSPLNRAQRRRVKKECDAVLRRLKPKTLIHHETGASVYRPKDVAEAMGMSEDAYDRAVRLMGFDTMTTLADIREFARVQ